MNILEVLKKEVNESIKEIYESTSSTWELERQTIKNIQSKGNMEMENLEPSIGTSDTKLFNRIQDMRERILGIEDKIEEIAT